jgi:NADPH:quinone reductase-like Zn-dependent oxidoreductase
MKAIHFKGYGELKPNIILKEIAIPVPSDDEVLIKIHAASINPVDYKMVKGTMRLLLRLKFPSRLGYDMSGTIVSAGKNVKGFKMDDEVYARAGDFHPGTFAEYITVEPKYLSMKPKNLSHEEAACIPLVGQTSVQAIRDKGKAKAGQKILIHAGSGGIGVFAIQYAKSLGLHVATTTSTANVAWVKSLGADIVIDYKKQNYLDLIKDYDLVFDTLGGKIKLDSFKVLKVGGKLVSILPPPDKQFAIEKKLNILLRGLLTLMNWRISREAKKQKVSYAYLLMETDGKNLDEITPIIEAGKIKVYIDRTYPLEETLEALEYVAAGRTKGKVVIKI